MIGLLISVFLIPIQSFGQPDNLDSVSMFMHDSITDTFNPSISQQEQKPPLALTTPNGLYKVELIWEPIEIKPNQIVRFDVKFTSPFTNRLVENVHYDFTVTKDGQTIKELLDSFALNGLTTHTVEFPSSGSFSVMINVLGVDGAISQRQNESVAFDLKVVPEFPISTVIVMASLVAIMIALTRFTVLSTKRK